MTKASVMFVGALMVGIVLLSAGCAGSNGEPWPPGDSSYVFTKPDAVFDLDKDLKEVSGLTTLADGRLAAVEDEAGSLFILDPQTGKVLASKKFAKRGDFEAVERAGDRLFALRSDGKIYEIEDWTGKNADADDHELDLPKNCDAEGLAFDGRRLLVSCKEEPGKKLKNAKAIYAVDLHSLEASKEPVYTIDPNDFSASVEDHPVNEAVRSVLSDRIDLSGFKPSDLAVHPITNELYVVSSVRKGIIAVDQSGAVTKLWMLDDDLFEQPEGITFLPNGDLFIASEKGGAGSARLFRFNYHTPHSQP